MIIISILFHLITKGFKRDLVNTRIDFSSTQCYGVKVNIANCGAVIIILSYPLSQDVAVPLFLCYMSRWYRIVYIETVMGNVK